MCEIVSLKLIKDGGAYDLLIFGRDLRNIVIDFEMFSVYLKGRNIISKGTVMLVRAAVQVNMTQTGGDHRSPTIFAMILNTLKF